MKTAFKLFALCLVLLYGREAYQFLRFNQFAESKSSGSLSDIADEVIAIPLQGSESRSFRNARHIRQDEENLFLISNETLYRFDRNGQCKNAITDPSQLRIADYLVNSAEKQLIVLGNTNDIFYYSYAGKLLHKKKLKSTDKQHRLLSAIFHGQTIVTLEECLRKDFATNQTFVCREIVTYDSTFHRIDACPIAPSPFNHPENPMGSLPSSIGIEPQSDAIYAFAPSLQPSNILRDTLTFQQAIQGEGWAELTSDQAIPVLPIRLGHRIWVSDYHQSSDPSRHYTFCFDTENGKSWFIQDGFQDDFYQTGNVRKLETMDPFGNSYCFCQSGTAIKQSFPKEAKNENAIVFIVHMKA